MVSRRRRDWYGASGGRGLQLSASLDMLGLNGLTAYFGLLDFGTPRAGETFIVSTAAGSVGSAVGQIAKIHGCRTVGIAGGADKVRQCLETFGFDACIDYKSQDVEQALGRPQARRSAALCEPGDSIGRSASAHRSVQPRRQSYTSSTSRPVAARKSRSLTSPHASAHSHSAAMRRARLAEVPCLRLSSTTRRATGSSSMWQPAGRNGKPR
jgi:hypothetical protein